MHLRRKNGRHHRQVRAHARGRNRSCTRAKSKRDSSTSCRLKRVCTYDGFTQVGSRSRDPIGYKDGQSLYRAYFTMRGVDPMGQWIMIPVFEFDEEGNPLPPTPESEDIPPSGPVVEPGILDIEDWLEDLFDDEIVDPLKEEMIEELEDWWDNHPLNPNPPDNGDTPCPPERPPYEPPQGPWDFNPDWHWPQPVDPMDPMGPWYWEFDFDWTW